MQGEDKDTAVSCRSNVSGTTADLWHG